jgi:hypothetical protein
MRMTKRSFVCIAKAFRISSSCVQKVEKGSGNHVCYVPLMER